MSETPLRNGLLLALCAILLIGNSMLEWVVDGHEGILWPGNVLRNWQDYGVRELEGKLVMNPGGYGLPVNPEIYPGHRPYTLYPVFALQQLFGQKVGIALFFALLSALVFVSLAFLLGWNERAFLISGISILTPGYLLWPKYLDPNTTTALLGAGYSALMWWRFQQTKLRWTDLLLLAIGTFVFTSLNWTTALVHAQLFCFLFVRKVSIRRLALYAAMGALALAPVLLASVRAKLGGQATAGGGLAAFLDTYAWGSSGGYSEGSSTSVLLIRYAFINGLALAPLWVVLAVTWVGRARRNFGRAILALAPLFMALLQTLALRNYFCHHPWMASPFLLLGAALSLSVLFEMEPKGITIAPYFALRKPFAWAGVAASFCFALVMLVSYRMNRAALDLVRDVVQQGTARSDLVVVAREISPELSADRALADLLDRRLLALDKLNEVREVAEAGILLSTRELAEDWSLVAKSSPPTGQMFQLLQKPLQWFQSKVSRREGTRISAPRTYFLYRAREVSGTTRSAAGLKHTMADLNQ
jgi:hypothetical protein